METYKIESEKTKEMVFTSTWSDAREDWNAQLGLLKRGTHPHINLQKHYDKYGEKDLILSSGKEVKKVEVKKPEPVEVKAEKPVIEKVVEKSKKTRAKK
jgi:Holliday junction resolvase-like predicted endonuclease